MPSVANNIQVCLLAATLPASDIMAVEGDRTADLQSALTTENDLTARRSAAQQLGELGPHAAAAEMVLVRALITDADAEVRHHAAWALGKIKKASPASLAALVAALADPIWTVRHNASLSLQWIGEPAIAPLTETLKNAPPLHQAATIMTLLAISPKEGTSHLPLVRSLLDTDQPVEVTVLALAAVGSIGLPAKEAVPDLVALLASSSSLVQKQALLSLRPMGESASTALPALQSLIASSRDRDLRIEAALTIGAVGHGHPAALNALLSCFDDTDSRVREYAAAALVGLGEGAVPALIKVLARKDARKRRLAATALGGMGSVAEAATPALLTALEDSDPQVRLAVIGALGLAARNDPAVRQPLIAARESTLPDSPLRAHIDQALASLDSRAIPAAAVPASTQE